jgi:hypothetical protein
MALPEVASLSVNREYFSIGGRGVGGHRRKHCGCGRWQQFTPGGGLAAGRN